LITADAENNDTGHRQYNMARHLYSSHFYAGHLQHKNPAAVLLQYPERTGKLIHKEVTF